MKRILLPILSFIFCSAAFPAEQGQLDGNLALFSVMAAINVAGFNADIDSTTNNPLRQQIREHLAKQKIDMMFDLKKFYREHKKASAAADMSQYVSFALCVESAPDFQYKFREQLRPPDVEALQGFETLMVKFHREARIDELWAKAQPAYDEVIAKYHPGVLQALRESNGYLRNPTSGYLGRKFQIYIDLLGAPNEVHQRSYKDDYYVVVTPSVDPQIDYIRRAYLHYLLDPLGFKYAEALEKKKALLDYAQAAPALGEQYKDDFVLLATMSLVKAVESRMQRGAKREEMVAQALKEGFILTPHFAEQLVLYEKQEAAMRYYLPDMIAAIDLKKEEGRLEKAEFSKERAVRIAKKAAPPPKQALTGVRKTLEDAIALYDQKDWAKAREEFLKVLKETEDKSLHAKAYYGLARIAALQKDPELAVQLFEKTLELKPDPDMAGWSHIYLGRLFDLANERQPATDHYKAVIALQGATPAAKEAARKGLEESFKREKK